MELSTNKYRKGLSSTESMVLSSLAREDKGIFKIDDVKKLLGKEKAKKIVYSLAKKKWILKLKKGLYAVVPLDIGVEGAESFIVHEFRIASSIITPYYIGFWSALNFYGFSDQIPSAIFVAVLEARKPIEVLNFGVRFVKLLNKKFFGFKEIQLEGDKVKISNPEKTIVDCLDHPEHCGGIDEIAKSIFFSHKELNFNRIREYGLKMENLTIFKRLGHIFEVTGLFERYKDIFKDIRISKGYSALDPLSPKKGRYSDRWNLLLNYALRPEGWMY